MAASRRVRKLQQAGPRIRPLLHRRIDSIRGYDSEDLAPRDPKYHDEIGGDRMGFLNFEYIWTFHPEMGIALVPFFDIGYNIDSKQTSDPSAT